MVHKDSRREDGKIIRKGRGAGVHHIKYKHGHSHHIRASEPPSPPEDYRRDYVTLTEYVPLVPVSGGGAGITDYHFDFGEPRPDGFVPFEMPKLLGDYRHVPKPGPIMPPLVDFVPNNAPEEVTPKDDGNRRKWRAIPLIPPIILLVAGLGLRNCGNDKPQVGVPPTGPAISDVCSADQSLAALPLKEKMVRMEILRLASESVGMQEGPGNSGPVEFTQGGKGPWCTAFTSGILRKADDGLIDRTASVWMFMEDAKKRGAIHSERAYVPIPGDVLVTYDPSRKNKPHTRIVTCVSKNGDVEFISGNSADPNGMEPDAVRREHFTKAQLEDLRDRYPESGYLNIGEALLVADKMKGRVGAGK